MKIKKTIRQAEDDAEDNMSLREAITHAEDVANTCSDKKCGQQHRQLAKWLKELQAYRLDR